MTRLTSCGLLLCTAMVGCAQSPPTLAAHASVECACGELGCGEPNCETSSPSGLVRGWRVNGNATMCGMELDCCVSRAGLVEHCEGRNRAARQPSPAARTEASSDTATVSEEPGPPIVPSMKPDRAMTTCPGMSADGTRTDVVGLRYQSAFGEPSLRVHQSHALAPPFGFAVSKRGQRSLVLIEEHDGQEFVVRSAFEIDIPCQNLTFDSYCSVDDALDEAVFALMDSAYTCGGHGQSSPARAWRVENGRATRIDERRVSCGSVSCEVDRP